MISPLRETTTPISRRSMSAGGISRPPSTTRAELALSAMVSHRVMFQPSIRLSMISIDGHTNAVARKRRQPCSRAPATVGRARTQPRTRRGVGTEWPSKRTRSRRRTCRREVPVVGFVDPHHLLHRLRRKARFVAAELRARRAACPRSAGAGSRTRPPPRWPGTFPSGARSAPDRFGLGECIGRLAPNGITQHADPLSPGEVLP